MPALPLDFEASAVPDRAASEPNVQDEVLALFDACAPGLRRYVQSCGLPPDAAEDVVQEAFVALFRHLCLGGSRRNLRGWLVRVCYRSALRQRKRRARRDGREVPWEPRLADVLACSEASPEDQLAADRRQYRLRAVVRALPERDRQCLYLRADGLPYRQIATTLGVSLGTVAKSLARAITRLSSAVQEQE
jgi:RNA polymerase sigma-70 factor (ECF subfamily)